MSHQLVEIVKSSKPAKKLMAVFLNTTTGRTKTVHFGEAGASDFTQHKDEDRKQRYLDRHRRKEDWNDPATPGALSRWILWNLPTLTASIRDYKKRFGY
jgi:hypothetical protein